MPAAGNEFLATALELSTAYAAVDTDPAIFLETMRRVVGESLAGADPSTAVAQVLFGLSALNAILLEDLAERAGCDRATMLASIHREYLVR